MKFTIATIITFATAINAFAIPGGYGQETPDPIPAAPVDTYPGAPPADTYPGGSESSAPEPSSAPVYESSAGVPAPAEPSASAPASVEPSGEASAYPSTPAEPSAPAESSPAPSAVPSEPAAAQPSVITQTVTVTGDCACAPGGGATTPGATPAPGGGYEDGAPPAEVPAAVHTVIVGGPSGDLTYKPPTVQAQIGDKVLFQFLEKNHTITESTFDIPCQAKEGVEVKFFPNPDGKPGVETEYLVEDAEPHWFYCAQGTHCSAGGMVFALNPTPEKTFGEFQEKAKTPAAGGEGEYEESPATPETPETPETPTEGTPTEGVPVNGGYESGAPAASSAPVDGGYEATPTGVPAENPSPVEPAPVDGGYQGTPTDIPAESAPAESAPVESAPVDGGYEASPTTAPADGAYPTETPAENPPVDGGYESTPPAANPDAPADAPAAPAASTSCTKTPGVPAATPAPGDGNYDAGAPAPDGTYSF